MQNRSFIAGKIAPPERFLSRMRGRLDALHGVGAPSPLDPAADIGSIHHPQQASA
ncbi:hypothetical protein [Zoogloea sp.]|uniref:hypothetical protein n=1 Tax=Zoogloea sp. TaxID=49181 RepID=UPI00260B6CE4|nr:hypothetical protein [Zoogloea sp.]MDD3354829.1 hypothetical protein [Zoogloea sp.]